MTTNTGHLILYRIAFAPVRKSIRASNPFTHWDQASSLGAKGKQLKKSPNKAGQGVDWGLGSLRSLILFLFFAAMWRQWSQAIHTCMRTVISAWFLYNEVKPVESCQSCKWTIHNLWFLGGGANWGS